MASWLDPSPPAHERANVLFWLRRFLIVLTILGMVALGAIVLQALVQIAEPIIFMLLSIVFAYLVYPLVKLLERVMPRFLAILVVYLGVLIALLALSYYVIITAVGELSSLPGTIQANMPAILSGLQPLTTTLNRIGIAPSQFQSSIQQLVNQLLTIVGTLPSFVSSLFTLIINIIIVTSLSIYFLLDGPRVLTWLRANIPIRQRPMLTFFLSTTDRVMGGFLRGQITLSILMSVIVGLGLFLLGVPYALLLALLVFVLEFVPQIGAYISGAIAILFALLTRGWGTALAVLVFTSLVQGILDGQILSFLSLPYSLGASSLDSWGLSFPRQQQVFSKYC